MPIGRTQPKTSLFQQTGIVYGPPKVGKTTLLSRFPRAVFLATERGHDHVNVDRWEKTPGDYVITSWEDLLLATTEVLKTDAETVIIDTIGNACQLADAYICKQSGEVYKNDGKLGFNKGTTLILNEVKRYLTKLASTGRGVWLVAHAATKTETKRTGNIEKTQPFFPGDNKVGDLYNGIIGSVDHVWYLESPVGADQPILHTKPNGTFDAGDRTGLFPASIDVTPDVLNKLQAFLTKTNPTTDAGTKTDAQTKKATSK